MMKFNVEGSFTLRKDSQSPKDICYYAIFSGYFSAGTTPVASRTEVAFPITRSEYELLEKQLERASCESPRLGVKGGLEIEVKADQIN